MIIKREKEAIMKNYVAISRYEEWKEGSPSMGAGERAKSQG